MGLKKAYQKVLEDISHQPGSAPTIAARAFRWIMDSLSPLHPQELVVAVRHSSAGLGDYDPDLDLNFVLEACNNLIVVQEESTKSSDPICRFSHLSVQEYLSSHEWPNKPEYQLLGAVCLHLFMSPDLPGNDALMGYARREMERHCERCDDGSSETNRIIAPLVARLEGQPTTNSSQFFKEWVQILYAS